MACPRQLDLYVALLIQERFKPQLDGGQVAVTPVVQCGPANLTHTLQKPVVLSVPHSAGGANAHSGVKRAMVLYCADLEHEHAEWEVVQQGDVVDMQVDSTMVHLVTERLGAYVLVANVTDLNQIGGGSGSACVSSSSSGHSSGDGSLISQQHSPRISPGTRAALCRLLDVPSCEGRGWQQLAVAMGAAHYAAFFASRQSPTDALLDLWEARNVTEDATDALTALASMLKEIRREDAIVILERDMR